MFLTTKGRYAVMIMVELASRLDGTPMSSKSLSESLGINSVYVDQILSKLRLNNIVKAIRGPGGGYVIVGHVCDINILDIMLAADENLKMTKCEAGDRSKCLSVGGSKCNTHHFWSEFEKKIAGFLSARTLESICKKQVIEKL